MTGAKRGDMVSIKDVAKRAGVSNGTVSRYFHEPHRVQAETRSRIKEAVELLGYAPNALAQNFRLGSTGIVLVLTSAVGDPFYGDVITGATAVATAKGYSVRIQAVEHGRLMAGELERIAASRQVDGIIVLGDAGPFPPPSQAKSPQNNLSIVVCGETSDAELFRYPRFQINGFAAAREVTEYLIGLGHSKIGYMRGETSLLSTDDREAGYRAAMETAGFEIAESWICNGQLGLEDARRAIGDLLWAETVPTALICANDEMAIGAMAELQSRGFSIPDDISVVGFDNTRYADTTNPPLTTVAQPALEIGERGMHCLLQTMQGKTGRTGIEFLPHRLIVRQSAKPPRIAQPEKQAKAGG